jgi:2-dehydropantoate 2-reductase
MKIAVVGIGGVGGYYGARLAARYPADRNVEVVFIVRGEHLSAIRSGGLRLVHAGGEVTVHPDLATDDPGDCGVFDLVLFCVKTYDLEQSARAVAGNIGNRTAAVTLLNGVDNADRLRSVIPNANIFNGCVYISSHIAAPGLVRQTGGNRRLFFGGKTAPAADGKRIEQIFRQAGIDARFTENIEQLVWEKFLFISPLAAATAYAGKTVGEVIRDPAASALLENLLTELLELARVRGLDFDESAKGETLEKARGFPPETKTSLQLDFEKGRRTELETFTGFVVREAHRLGVAAPHYERIHAALAGGRRHRA